MAFFENKIQSNNKMLFTFIFVSSVVEKLFTSSHLSIRALEFFREFP